MRNSQQHICALIPTFNNGGTILDVVRRVHSFVRDVIIVDDGSTDDTPQLLATLDFEVTVVTHTRNKGKGAALKSGFKKAIELGFDYALTIDADGQHYPEDIPLLLKALDVHPNNLIVGIRQFTDESRGMGTYRIKVTQDNTLYGCATVYIVLNDLLVDLLRVAIG